VAITTLPPVPNSLPQIINWLNRLRVWLHRVMQGLSVRHVIFQELHAEPERPENGMVVLADGTDWKPNGTGTEGIYRYKSDGSTWVKLG
jgi:hypothetical protein